MGDLRLFMAKAVVSKSMNHGHFTTAESRDQYYVRIGGVGILPFPVYVRGRSLCRL